MSEDEKVIDMGEKEVAKDAGTYVEVGMTVGRYTELLSRIKKKDDGKWYLESAQELNLSRLIADIFGR